MYTKCYKPQVPKSRTLYYIKMKGLKEVKYENCSYKKKTPKKNDMILQGNNLYKSI